MTTILRTLTAATLAAMLFVSFTGVAADDKPKKAPFSLAPQGKALGDTCFIMPIECGDVWIAWLEPTDCQLDDLSYVDFWEFAGEAGQAVAIDMISDDVDPYLFLIDPAPEVRASDDDGGVGLNARILHVLESSGLWTIAANSFWPLETGGYVLALQCSAAPGIFSDGFESGDVSAWN